MKKQTTYSNSKIKELLTKITVENKNEFSKLVKIISVDDDNFTCECQPLDGTPNFFDVRFTASDSPSFIIYPKVDSICIINYLDVQNAYISKNEVADKYTFKNDDADLKEILKTYIDDLHSALGAATWSTAQGPTVPGAINSTQFDKAKSDAKDKIDKLFK